MIDELIRSARKTVQIAVTPEMKVVVRAPKRLPLREIERFVQAQEKWIIQQKQKLEPQYRLRAAFTADAGQYFPVLGELRTITLAERMDAALERDCLLLPEDTEKRLPALEQLLRRTTSEQVTRLIRQHSASMQLYPTKLVVTSAKTRWGSCGKNGHTCFSWRVACLPLPLMEYIVVHELAHLREHNHSPQFWTVVAAELPDARQRRQALRELQWQIPM